MSERTGAAPVRSLEERLLEFNAEWRVAFQNDLLTEAASALASLREEMDRWHREAAHLADYRAYASGKGVVLQDLRDRAERAEAERDALRDAARDLSKMARIVLGEPVEGYTHIGESMKRDNLAASVETAERLLSPTTAEGEGHD